MGVRILTDDDYQAFYCSTTMTAFGPIMYGDAEEFEEWLDIDPRKIDDNELESKYCDFRSEKEESEEEYQRNKEIDRQVDMAREDKEEV